MIPPIVADTGGLLRALACTADGKPTFPEYENILTTASVVIVPGLVLAKIYEYRKRDVDTARQVYRRLTFTKSV